MAGLGLLGGARRRGRGALLGEGALGSEEPADQGGGGDWGNQDASPAGYDDAGALAELVVAPAG